MLDIGIMIEGQNGLDWAHWQRIAATVEACGYWGLFRSDHFTNGIPPDKASLECWVSLTWLACHTEHIEFGSLVSPISFRHPAHLARMAAAVDDLSGGRLTLGVGAGWQEREHTNYGFDLLELDDRFLRFEEGLEIISRLLKSDEPTSYEGQFFKVNDAILLPRPQRIGGPPILIGGNGVHRTLPLAARFAAEWNMLFIPPEKIAQLNSKLDSYLENQGRRTKEIRRSLMTACIFGVNRKDVEQKVNQRTRGQKSVEDLRKQGFIVGTAPEIVEQCQRIASAGIQRVMLQWIDLDDIDGLGAMADGILDKLSG